jgi:hypothetical protein
MGPREGGDQTHSAAGTERQGRKRHCGPMLPYAPQEVCVLMLCRELCVQRMSYSNAYPGEHLRLPGHDVEMR